MSNKLYEWEDEGGRLWKFDYYIEPFNKGGRDEPPSGGYAVIEEIRRDDNTTVPAGEWNAIGFDEDKLKEIEEELFEWACEMERGRREDAMERKAEERREARHDL